MSSQTVDGGVSACAELAIEGMVCEACVGTVQHALSQLPPGALLSADVTLGRARVRYAPRLIAEAALLEGASP